MKRFYLFLGLLCTTTGASYAVQNNQYARVSTTKQTTGISETKKSILPTKKNTDTPVLSAVVRSGTGTLGSLSVNNDEQRLSLSNKTGLNKKIVQPGNSYKIPVPANIQQPESVAAATKVSALEKQIEELQAVVSTMDSKIAQAKQEAKDAAVQDAKKEIADEKKEIEQNIKTAKEEAVAVAANNAAAKFVETKDIDSKVDAALETKKVLTADSETLKDFVKTKDFTKETTKIQKDIENAKAAAKDETIAIVDSNFVTNVDKVLETKQFLTADSETLKDFVKTKDFTEEKAKIIETAKNEAIKDAMDYSNNATGKLWEGLKDYATNKELSDLRSLVDENKNQLSKDIEGAKESVITSVKNEYLPGIQKQIDTNAINIQANKDNFTNYVSTGSLSEDLKDYAKISDLKDLTSKVDANNANIADNKNNIEKYKNELWAQVNANTNNFANYATTASLDDYAKTSDLSGYATTEALTNLSTTVTQNKTETDAATDELRTQVNENTSNFANYATTASLSDYATTASLEDIQTDVDNMAQIISLTTDEAMKNSPKFNTVMTNHNIAVGIYEGDDKLNTNP